MIIHPTRGDLEAWRGWLKAGGAPARAAAAALQEAAVRVCELPPMAVTDKHDLPHRPHADRRDYVSIATYFWPNPDTPDGLPWGGRDGEMSPALSQYDRPRWDTLANGAALLIRAAALLDRPDFADHAAGMLRRWFISSDTGMTPHLAHGQFVPGRDTGRPTGIIDFALRLPDLLDHVLLLRDLYPASWSADDHAALQRWCEQLLHWLRTSDFGRHEDQAANNHSVYYDRLVAHLAVYVGDRDDARQRLERVPDRRILPQVEPDGRMPHELGRTLSFGYSLMNVTGLVDLALLGRQVGLNLWRARTHDGRGIEQAVRFLYEHAASDAPWPWKQIDPTPWPRLIPLLHKARRGYGDAFPIEGVRHRFDEPIDPRRWMMLADLHPFRKGVTYL